MNVHWMEKRTRIAYLSQGHDSCKMQSTALKIVGDRDRHEAFPDQVFLKIVLTGDNSYNQNPPIINSYPKIDFLLYPATQSVTSKFVCGHDNKILYQHPSDSKIDRPATQESLLITSIKDASIVHGHDICIHKWISCNTLALLVP